MMTYLLAKTLISAALVVTVSELAKRSPSFGALVASLPLVSVLGMVWLWRDTGDPARMAAHVEATFLEATFWYVLPSLPMFLLIPAMLRAGASFWLALATGIALTTALYLLTAAILARFGITL
jgi:hypothetical protein